MLPLSAPSATYQLTSSASESIDDAEWDAFLSSTPLGQFQQSSMWAKYKNSEGWKVSRCIFRDVGPIRGGFQLLWRQSRLGRIGYVSKGPVAVAREGDHAPPPSLKPLIELGQRCGLQAIVVQPPDAASDFWSENVAPEFEPERSGRVIRANLVVHLGAGFEAAEASMWRSTLKKVRQARKLGLEVRELPIQELDIMFRMMLESCRRQNQRLPNPPTLDSLRMLCECFRSSGRARITVANFGGKAVAGLLALTFGKRMTLWKKGWLQEANDGRANTLLHHDAFRWAVNQGMEIADFGGMRYELARQILSGTSPDECHTPGRDYFNLGFGGKPRLLPEARIWFRGRAYRFAYQAYEALQRLLRRR